MNTKKQLAINMGASITCFIINLIINFFLSPYIIANVGTEAYGFVSLANNFVNYATIITIALNSMASRFITIAIHNNKKEEVNKYYTSILIANIFLITLLIIPAIVIVLYLEKFLNISIDLIWDVKLLFSLIFFNFFVTIIDSTYSIATFATNKLYLKSIKTIEAYVLKISIMFLAFICFKPSVFFVGLATAISSIFLLLWNMYYTKTLLPNVEIKKKYFDYKKVKELIGAGIWNTITKLGTLLTDGLDLVICNLLINPIAMGQLAIVKTLSSAVGSLISTVSSVFQPQLTVKYAKGEIQELVEELKTSMKITGIFANIPLVFLIIFGPAFYALWTPSENSSMLTILTVLTLQGVIISGVITPMYSIYTITNKIKVDAICRVIIGIICVPIVFILLKTTNLGIYAVAGVSTTIGTIFNFFFVPMYCSYCLKIKSKGFYFIIFKYILTTLIIISILFGIKQVLYPTSWLSLICAGIVTCIIGFFSNYFILINNKERKIIYNMIYNKLRRN